MLCSSNLPHIHPHRLSEKLH